jgi:hypothetical protein
MPGTSSLDFASGQTVANLVIVPLNNGIADIYNGSPGTVQVVADLAGYYAAGAPDRFVPYQGVPGGPLRVTASGPVPPFGSTLIGEKQFDSCSPICPGINALVATVTVVTPTRAGYLTIYPANQARPVVSNLDFTAGQAISNMIMTTGTDLAYNGSPGTIKVVVDEYGYFIRSLTSGQPLPDSRTRSAAQSQGRHSAGALTAGSAL